MSKRRVVCGRRFTVHRCGDDDRLLVMRIRTKRLDVRHALRPADAAHLAEQVTLWCNEIGAQLVGTEDEDE